MILSEDEKFMDLFKGYADPLPLPRSSHDMVIDKSRQLEKPAISLFDSLEIYPGSKLKHFQALQKKTGIPYEEMLFFDDESRNKEVEQLGVMMYLIDKGVYFENFLQGLNLWNHKRGRKRVVNGFFNHEL